MIAKLETILNIRIYLTVAFFLKVLLVSGCATTTTQTPVPGPYGTIASPELIIDAVGQIRRIEYARGNKSAPTFLSATRVQTENNSYVEHWIIDVNGVAVVYEIEFHTLMVNRQSGNQIADYTVTRIGEKLSESTNQK